MNETGEVQLWGLDPLEAIPTDRILLIGFDVPGSPEGRALLAALPGAQVVSLNDRNKQIFAAGRAVAARRCDVVVTVQNFRKLKLLAMGARASRRYSLVHGRLVKIDPVELMLQLAPPVRRGVEGARRRLVYPRFPEPLGPGNDYSQIEERVSALPPGWPRLRASVIVPVYNRKPVLAKTLAALTLQTYPRELFEVIIADDGSSDDPEELVGVYRDRIDVRCVRQEDLGYRLAEVRNLAIQSSSCDVIVSLDCDMLPEPRFLESHLRWFHGTDESVVVIGYRKFVDTSEVAPEDVVDGFDVVRRLPEVLAPAAIRAPDSPTVDWRNATFEKTRFLKDHQAPYLLASGGNVAYRTSDALVAGLYHPGFRKWGGEDADFAYRLERLGCYFVAEPGALAYHQDHPSSVVREEDQITTRDILGRRVPRLREHARVEVAKFEQPMVSVIVVDGGDSEVEATRASLVRQSLQDFELLVTAAPEEGLAQARGEYLMFLRSGEELLPSALEYLTWALRRNGSLAFVLGGVTSNSGEYLPRRYSRLEHMMGVYLGCPALLRTRDVARVSRAVCTAGAAYELDLTLRMAERGEAEAHPLAFLYSPRPRDFTKQQLIGIVHEAVARLDLGWRIGEGWPPALTSGGFNLDSVALEVRRRWIERCRTGSENVRVA